MTNHSLFPVNKLSILSNTVARIDANVTQEYLDQFSISTIEGIKPDALFSYQPPFNILALIILWPASWFLTPRALHTLNVFLIKVTSLPQLIVIGLYKHHLANGRKFRETSFDLAQSLFNRLPRQIKNMPLVEALVGSTTNDLFKAIFDVELDDEYDLLEEYDEDDRLALRSQHSRETLGTRAKAGENPTRQTRLSMSRSRPPETTHPGVDEVPQASKSL